MILTLLYLLLGCLIINSFNGFFYNLSFNLSFQTLLKNIQKNEILGA